MTRPSPSHCSDLPITTRPAKCPFHQDVTRPNPSLLPFSWAVPWLVYTESALSLCRHCTMAEQAAATPLEERPDMMGLMPHAWAENDLIMAAAQKAHARSGLHKALPKGPSGGPLLNAAKSLEQLSGRRGEAAGHLARRRPAEARRACRRGLESALAFTSIVDTLAETVRANPELEHVKNI